MQHSTAVSCNDVNGNYHTYKDHLLLHCNSTAAGGHQNMPLFHSNVHSFSTCALQDGPVMHFCTGACTVEPFQRQESDTLVSSRNRDALHEPSIVLDKSNYETMLAHVLPEAPAPFEYTSPEALLEGILIAQKKLQHLQAIAEVMVHVGDQAQQQQSLVASVKSIMSQLLVVTAGLKARPAPCLKQNLGPSSQLNQGSTAQLNQTLDLRFDGFHSNGMNISIPPPLGSFTGTPGEGKASLCPELMHSTMELVHMRSVGTTQLSTLMGPRLTRSAMELVCMKDVDVSKLSGIKDRQLKEQALNSSLGEPANHLRHSNTSNMLVESDILNGSPYITVETCDSHGTDGNGNQEMFGLEDHDYASVFRDDDDDGEAENLPPGSYELVEMAAAEILAEHTHFCEICGKGFKRDANLRMHMRGHGDEYKTLAALARPDKSSHSPSMVKFRRYSCPYVGCKRNQKHRKFLPLKTTLCVKNHYRRSHCPKLLICSKCKAKKFSVVADLKTHEKHCGQDKWQCSCGTTFSRKDKLVGHVSLFAGHTPAVPIHETESLNEPLLSSLPTRGEEEGLSTSEAPHLGTLESFSGPSNKGPMLIMGETADGFDIPDLTIMGKEVLTSDKNGQQRTVYPGEKSVGEKRYLAENSERGAMEVMQHCG